MDKMIEDSNKKFAYLTSDNWVGWYERLIVESSNLIGMVDLLKNNRETNFDMLKPDYRIRIIEEGRHKTSEDRQRNGFITDEHGDYLTVSEEVRREVYKTWVRDADILYKEKEKYNTGKRMIKKYIMQHLSKEILDMLKRHKEYDNCICSDYIIGMMRIIKHCATGRGSSSVVLDGQRIMNMRLKGESTELILSTVNDFSDNVAQLKEGRSDKEVVDGLLNGIFMVMFAPCKALDRQIEELMDKREHPSWEEMAEKFTEVLMNKKHLKRTILKGEVDYGLVEANFTQEESNKNQSEMICFKCGQKGHSLRRCTKAIGICKICGKSHHTNAHEIYNTISKKKNAKKKYKFSYEKDVEANDTSVKGESWDDLNYEDQYEVHGQIDDYCRNIIRIREEAESDEDSDGAKTSSIYTQKASIIDDEVLEDIYCGATNIELNHDYHVSNNINNYNLINDNLNENYNDKFNLTNSNANINNIREEKFVDKFNSNNEDNLDVNDDELSFLMEGDMFNKINMGGGTTIYKKDLILFNSRIKEKTDLLNDYEIGNYFSSDEEIEA